MLIIDLLKSYFNINDRDDRREMRDKVLARELRLDPALEPVPALFSLLDMPVEDPAWETLALAQRRLGIH